ncbi:MAG: DUF2934 domain-containing protein, partial [Deltaproteobacteria bacterium]|nr:DUF2934 domain-containing protein [Deltaproteobacteria bacterium]
MSLLTDLKPQNLLQERAEVLSRLGKDIIEEVDVWDDEKANELLKDVIVLPGEKPGDIKNIFKLHQKQDGLSIYANIDNFDNRIGITDEGEIINRDKHIPLEVTDPSTGETSTRHLFRVRDTDELVDLQGNLNKTREISIMSGIEVDPWDSKSVQSLLDNVMIVPDGAGGMKILRSQGTYPKTITQPGTIQQPAVEEKKIFKPPKPKVLEPVSQVQPTVTAPTNFGSNIGTLLSVSMLTAMPERAQGSQDLEVIPAGVRAATSRRWQRQGQVTEDNLKDLAIFLLSKREEASALLSAAEMSKKPDSELIAVGPGLMDYTSKFRGMKEGPLQNLLLSLVGGFDFGLSSETLWDKDNEDIRDNLRDMLFPGGDYSRINEDLDLEKVYECLRPLAGKMEAQDAFHRYLEGPLAEERKTVSTLLPLNRQIEEARQSLINKILTDAGKDPDSIQFNFSDIKDQETLFKVKQQMQMFDEFATKFMDTMTKLGRNDWQGHDRFSLTPAVELPFTLVANGDKPQETGRITGRQPVGTADNLLLQAQQVINSDRQEALSLMKKAGEYQESARQQAQIDSGAANSFIAQAQQSVQENGFITQEALNYLTKAQAYASSAKLEDWESKAPLDRSVGGGRAVTRPSSPEDKLAVAAVKIDSINMLIEQDDDGRVKASQIDAIWGGDLYTLPSVERNPNESLRVPKQLVEMGDLKGAESALFGLSSDQQALYDTHDRFMQAVDASKMMAEAGAERAWVEAKIHERNDEVLSTVSPSWQDRKDNVKKALLSPIGHSLSSMKRAVRALSFVSGLSDKDPKIKVYSDTGTKRVTSAGAAENLLQARGEYEKRATAALEGFKTASEFNDRLLETAAAEGQIKSTLAKALPDSMQAIENNEKKNMQAAEVHSGRWDAASRVLRQANTITVNPLANREEREILTTLHDRRNEIAQKGRELVAAAGKDTASLSQSLSNTDSNVLAGTLQGEQAKRKYARINTASAVSLAESNIAVNEFSLDIIKKYDQPIAESRYQNTGSLYELLVSTIPAQASDKYKEKMKRQIDAQQGQYYEAKALATSTLPRQAAYLKDVIEFQKGHVQQAKALLKGLDRNVVSQAIGSAEEFSALNALTQAHVAAAAEANVYLSGAQNIIYYDNNNYLKVAGLDRNLGREVKPWLKQFLHANTTVHKKQEAYLHGELERGARSLGVATAILDSKNVNIAQSALSDASLYLRPLPQKAQMASIAEVALRGKDELELQIKEPYLAYAGEDGFWNGYKALRAWAGDGMHKVLHTVTTDIDYNYAIRFLNSRQEILGRLQRRDSDYFQFLEQNRDKQLRYQPQVALNTYQVLNSQGKFDLTGLSTDVRHYVIEREILADTAEIAVITAVTLGTSAALSYGTRLAAGTASASNRLAVGGSRLTRLYKSANAAKHVGGSAAQYLSQMNRTTRLATRIAGLSRASKVTGLTGRMALGTARTATAFTNTFVKTGKLVGSAYKIGAAASGIGIGYKVVSDIIHNRPIDTHEVLGTAAKGYNYGFKLALAYNTGAGVLKGTRLAMAYGKLTPLGKGLTVAGINEAVAHGVTLISTGSVKDLYDSPGDIFTHTLLIGSGLAAGIAPTVARAPKLGKLYQSANAAKHVGGSAAQYLSRMDGITRVVSKLGAIGAKAPKLTHIAAASASQAPLWGEWYLVTHMGMSALEKQPLDANLMWENYKKGASGGAIFGGFFGTGSIVVQKINPGALNKLATSNKLSHKLVGKAGQFMKAHPYVPTTIGGAATFPLAKTVIEGGRDQEGFAPRLIDNYQNPYNYLRGAIIGFAGGWGFSKPAGKLAGVQKYLGRGILQKHNTFSRADLRGLSRFKVAAKNTLLAGEKIIYGGSSAVVAGTGVNALRGDYKGENKLIRIGLDSAGYFTVGGLASLYTSSQGKNILKGIKSYGPGRVTGGLAHHEHRTLFNIINLGKAATGPELLFKTSLTGAIEWTMVSPAFSVGGALWNNLKVDKGYYDNKVSEGVRQRLDNVVWFLPHTWVAKGGYLPVESGDRGVLGVDDEGQLKEFTLTFRDFTVKDIAQSVITGPRSGLWMKPMISLFQAKVDTPTWYNQRGLIGKPATLAKSLGRGAKWFKDGFSKRGLTSRAPTLRGRLINGAKWFKQGFDSKVMDVATRMPQAGLKGVASKALGWVDARVLWMPGFVTSIDAALEIADDVALDLSGQRPRFEKMLNDYNEPVLAAVRTDGTKVYSYQKQDYISPGMHELGKWLPFFMFPAYHPPSDDINLSRMAKEGADNFTPRSYRRFIRTQDFVRQHGGLAKVYSDAVGVEGKVGRDYLREAVRYLRDSGVGKGMGRRQASALRRSIIEQKASLSDRALQTGIDHLRLSYQSKMDGNDKLARQSMQNYIAHKIWLSEGKPEGRANVHWELAGKVLEGKQQEYLAHMIWVAEGKPEGRASTHWDMAGKIIQGGKNLERIIHNYNQVNGTQLKFTPLLRVSQHFRGVLNTDRHALSAGYPNLLDVKQQWDTFVTRNLMAKDVVRRVFMRSDKPGEQISLESLNDSSPLKLKGVRIPSPDGKGTIRTDIVLRGEDLGVMAQRFSEGMRRSGSLNPGALAVRLANGLGVSVNKDIKEAGRELVGYGRVSPGTARNINKYLRSHGIINSLTLLRDVTLGINPYRHFSFNNRTVALSRAGTELASRPVRFHVDGLAEAQAKLNGSLIPGADSKLRTFSRSFQKIERSYWQTVEKAHKAFLEGASPKQLLSLDKAVSRAGIKRIYSQYSDLINQELTQAVAANQLAGRTDKINLSISSRVLNKRQGPLASYLQRKYQLGNRAAETADKLLDLRTKRDAQVTFKKAYPLAGIQSEAVALDFHLSKGNVSKKDMTRLLTEEGLIELKLKGGKRAYVNGEGLQGARKAAILSTKDLPTLRKIHHQLMSGQTFTLQDPKIADVSYKLSKGDKQMFSYLKTLRHFKLFEAFQQKYPEAFEALKAKYNKETGEIKLSLDGYKGKKGASFLRHIVREFNSYKVDISKFKYNSPEAARRDIFKGLLLDADNPYQFSSGDVSRAVGRVLKITAEYLVKEGFEGSEFDSKKFTEQSQMVLSLLGNHNVGLTAGGGKTLGGPVELITRELIVGNLSKVLVVRPGEIGKIIGKDAEPALKGLLGKFGMELVNGNKPLGLARQGGHLDQLKKDLASPQKIVVFDHTQFGHIRNNADKGLKKLIQDLNVVRIDEFHQPLSDKVSFIVGGDHTPLLKLLGEDGFSERDLVSVEKWVEKNIKTEYRSDLGHTKYNALRDSKPAIYRNTLTGEFGLNDAAMKLLDKSLPSRHNVLVRAYLEAKFSVPGHNYNIATKAGMQQIVPVERGVNQLDRVIGDHNYLAFLARKEGVSLKNITATRTTSQATLSEVLRFNPYSSVLGYSGTLAGVRMMLQMHMGKGVNIISPTDFNGRVIDVNGLSKGRNTVEAVSRLVASSIKAGKDRGMLIFCNDQSLFNELQKSLEKFGKERVTFIHGNTPDAEIVRLSKKENQGKIILSNIRGATGYSYAGNRRLIVADGHNWNISDLSQAIYRNNRSGQKERRVILFEGSKLAKNISSRANRLMKAPEKFGRLTLESRDVQIQRALDSSHASSKTNMGNLLRNANYLELIQQSQAIVHHTREAAYSRHLIEPLKEMMSRAVTDTEREFIRQRYNDVIRHKGSGQLALSKYALSGQGVVRELLQGIARYSQESIFNRSFYNNKQVSTRNRVQAEILAKDAAHLLANYSHLKKGGSFRQAVTLSDVASAAKGFQNRILPSDTQVQGDILQSKTNVKVLETLTAQRQQHTSSSPEALERATAHLLSVMHTRSLSPLPTRASKSALIAARGFLTSYAPSAPPASGPGAVNVAGLIDDFIHTLPSYTPDSVQPEYDYYTQYIDSAHKFIDNNVFKDHRYSSPELADTLSTLAIPQTARIEAPSFDSLTNFVSLSVIQSPILSSQRFRQIKDDFQSRTVYTGLLTDASHLSTRFQQYKTYNPVVLAIRSLGDAPDKVFLSDTDAVVSANPFTARQARQLVKATSAATSFADSYHRASDFIHSVTGKTIVEGSRATGYNWGMPYNQIEAVQFTLLRMNDPGLSWNQFREAKSWSGHLEGLGAGNIRLRGNEAFQFNKHKQLALIDGQARRLGQRLENKEISLLTAWREQERLKAQRKKIEKQELWGWKDILSPYAGAGASAWLYFGGHPVSAGVALGASLIKPGYNIYRYHIKGEKPSFTAGALLAHSGSDLGALELVKPIADKLPGLSASVIDHITSKVRTGEQQHSKLYLADLFENGRISDDAQDRKIAQNTATLTRASTPPIDTLVQRNKVYENYQSLVRDSNFDYELKQQIREDIAQARQIPSLLIPDYQFRQTAAGLDIYSHQIALDRFEGTRKAFMQRLGEYKKYLAQVPSRKDITQWEAIEKRLKTELKDLLNVLVDMEQITAQEKEQFLNVDWWLTQPNPAFGRIAFQRTSGPNRVRDILLDEIKPLITGKSSRTLMKKVAVHKRTKFRQAIDLMVRAELNKYDLPFHSEVLTDQINELKEARQKAEDSLDKILADNSEDKYIRRYADASRNTTLDTFADNIRDENNRLQPSSFRERLNTFELWQDRDKIAEKLEQDPEVTVIIKDGRSRTKERIFRDSGVWLDWRIKGIDKTLAKDDLSLQDRAWYSAQRGLFQAKLDKFKNELPALRKRGGAEKREIRVQISQLQSKVQGLQAELGRNPMRVDIDEEINRYNGQITSLRKNITDIDNGLKKAKEDLRQEIIAAAKPATPQTSLKTGAELNYHKRVFGNEDSDLNNWQDRLNFLQRYGMAPAVITGAELTPEDIRNRYTEKTAQLERPKPFQAELQAPSEQWQLDNFVSARDIVGIDPSRTLAQYKAPIEFRDQQGKLIATVSPSVKNGELTLPDTVKGSDGVEYKIIREEDRVQMLAKSDWQWLDKNNTSTDKFQDRAFFFTKNLWEGKLDIDDLDFTVFKNKDVVDVGGKLVVVAGGEEEHRDRVKTALGKIGDSNGTRKIQLDGSSMNGQMFSQDKDISRLNLSYLHDGLTEGILKAALNGHDGPVSQAVEILPRLLSSNGELKGTSLEGIGDELAKVDLSRRRRRRLVGQLIDNIEQANNGEGKHIGGIRKGLAVWGLAWDIEQALRQRQQDTEPRLDRTGGLVPADTFDSWADVVVPFSRTLGRLHQLPEDGLMRLVNGRKVSQIYRQLPKEQPQVEQVKPNGQLLTSSEIANKYAEKTGELERLKQSRTEQGIGRPSGLTQQSEVAPRPGIIYVGLDGESNHLVVPVQDHSAFERAVQQLTEDGIEFGDIGEVEVRFKEMGTVYAPATKAALKLVREEALSEFRTAVDSLRGFRGSGQLTSTNMAEVKATLEKFRPVAGYEADFSDIDNIDENNLSNRDIRRIKKAGEGIIKTHYAKPFTMPSLKQQEQNALRQFDSRLNYLSYHAQRKEWDKRDEVLGDLQPYFEKYDIESIDPARLTDDYTATEDYIAQIRTRAAEKIRAHYRDYHNYPLQRLVERSGNTLYIDSSHRNNPEAISLDLTIGLNTHQPLVNQISAVSERIAVPVLSSGHTLDNTRLEQVVSALEPSLTRRQRRSAIEEAHNLMNRLNSGTGKKLGRRQANEALEQVEALSRYVEAATQYQRAIAADDSLAQASARDKLVEARGQIEQLRNRGINIRLPDPMRISQVREIAKASTEGFAGQRRQPTRQVPQTAQTPFRAEALLDKFPEIDSDVRDIIKKNNFSDLAVDNLIRVAEFARAGKINPHRDETIREGPEAKPDALGLIRQFAHVPGMNDFLKRLRVDRPDQLKDAFRELEVARQLADGHGYELFEINPRINGKEADLVVVKPSGSVRRVEVQGGEKIDTQRVQSFADRQFEEHRDAVYITRKGSRLEAVPGKVQTVYHAFGEKVRLRRHQIDVGDNKVRILDIPMAGFEEAFRDIQADSSLLGKINSGINKARQELDAQKKMLAQRHQLPVPLVGELLKRQGLEDAGRMLSQLESSRKADIRQQLKQKQDRDLNAVRIAEDMVVRQRVQDLADALPEVPRRQLTGLDNVVEHIGLMQQAFRDNIGREPQPAELNTLILEVARGKPLGEAVEHIVKSPSLELTRPRIIIPGQTMTGASKELIISDAGFSSGRLSSSLQDEEPGISSIGTGWSNPVHNSKITEALRQGRFETIGETYDK